MEDNKITVLFGTELVRQYGETGKIDVDLGCVVEKEFESEKELKAYLEGVDDSAGWLEYCVKEEKKTTDPVLLKDVVVYDDGGKTVDRYTIIIPDKSVYGMSSDPFSPQGFNQYVGELSEFPDGLSHTGKKVEASSLPENIQKAILQRMKDNDTEEK